LTPKAAPLYFRFDASQTSLEPWATDYVPDQADATQPGSLHFGGPAEEINEDFLNLIPELAPPTQWWFPEEHGAVWDGAYRESQYSPNPPFDSADIGLRADGDPTPSASTSSTVTGSPSYLWDSPPPPECNTTHPGIDGAMYVDGSSTPLMTTGLEPSTGFVWVDNAVFVSRCVTLGAWSTSVRQKRRRSMGIGPR